MGSFDGHVYPVWSGLNDADASLKVEDALDHAIKTVRYVWHNDSRKSGEALARLITGSECISLLFALEGALASLSPQVPA